MECVGILLRKCSNLLVLPIATLDHRCCYLLLLLQPPTLKEENEAPSEHLKAHLVDSGPPLPPRVSSLKLLKYHLLILCVYIGCLCVDTRRQFVALSSLLPP